MALALLTALGAALALVAVIEFRDFLADRSSRVERTRLFAARDTDAAAAHIDGELEAFAAEVRGIAEAIETGAIERASVESALLSRVEALHNVNGIVAAFEPYPADGLTAYAPHTHRMRSAGTVIW